MQWVLVNTDRAIMQQSWIMMSGGKSNNRLFKKVKLNGMSQWVRQSGAGMAGCRGLHTITLWSDCTEVWQLTWREARRESLEAILHLE